MNEEIKYHESLPTILDYIKSNIYDILTTLQIDGVISDGTHTLCRETTKGVFSQIFICSHMHLMKLYDRQTNDIPQAPTFTAGDQ
jgi:hypothetical protein